MALAGVWEETFPFRALRGFVWVDTSVKTPAWRRRHSRRACFPGQGRGGPPKGAAGTPWRLGRSCHPTQLTSQQCTQMPQNGSERPFSPICVHSCVPTAARATGRGHGSHDINDPMAPVMPGPRALGPDGPSISCQVHVPVGPLPVWSSVCPCVWCRRWLESKVHASVGQTPPSLAPQSCKARDWGCGRSYSFRTSLLRASLSRTQRAATRGQPPHRLCLSDRRAQPPLRWEG